MKISFYVHYEYDGSDQAAAEQAIKLVDDLHACAASGEKSAPAVTLVTKRATNWQPEEGEEGVDF